MATICSVCGSANDPRAQFCSHPGCGAYLGRDDDRGRAEEHVGGRLELAAPRLAVAPGGAVTTELTVHNTGTMVERFHLWVAGDAGSWAQVEPDEVSAYPGDSVTSAVTFTPPPPPTSPSGSIRFEVMADSTVHPSLQLCAPGTITVSRSPAPPPPPPRTPRPAPPRAPGPPSALALDLAPTTTRGGARTTVRLELENRTRGPLQVRLEAEDPQAELTFEMPPGITARPGHATIPITVSATRPFVGTPRTVPFEVRAVPSGGPPVAAGGTRIITPALAVWQLVLIGVLVLLVVLGFVVAGTSGGGGSYGAPWSPTTGERSDA